MPVQAAVKGGAVGLNFEYGSVYVAGGYDKAAIYAQTAPELISFVRTLLDVAERRGINAVSDGLEGYPDLKEFLRHDPEPVVLKLPPIPVSLIQNERGGPVEMLSVKMDSNVADAFWSQMAFRLIEAIPFDGIEVIEASGYQRSAPF